MNYLKPFAFTLFIITLATFNSTAQPGDYDFLLKRNIELNKTVDPTSVTEITLDNGLTVYLNEDPNISNVFGAVAIKGGSKRDPDDYTGIAHYFEHIMFKGTEEIGTVDFGNESIYLDSISLMYDQLGEAVGEEARNKILTKINDLSLKASSYAIPNELDKVLEKMGSTGVNAFTSKDAIVYFNYFPGNQIEKWLEVYSHRFEKPVYRLFQSELETVYEEKNMYMDNPFTQVMEIFEAELFEGHPYSQTVLGKVEHLKNPSLRRMNQYFEKYYVANNMALILVGNFNADEVIPYINEKFGKWRSGKIEPFEAELKAIEKRVEISKRLTPIKVGLMGFQTVHKGHKDELPLNIANSILSNSSSTGLFDKLTNENELMAAMVMPMPYVEAGANIVVFIPKLIGQSLSKAEKLVLGQIEELKAGSFDDALLEAIKTELIVEHEKGLENGKSRGFYILDAFLEGEEWGEILAMTDKIANITRKDIIRVANIYYGSNYVALHSKSGFPKKIKLDKPPYKPVEAVNSESTSVKALEIEEIPVIKEKVKFIEKGRDVFNTELNELSHFYYVPNPVNNLFELTLNYGVGTQKNKYLSYSSQLMYLLGTDQRTADEFNLEMQKLGSQFSVSSGRDYTTVRVSGLDKNFHTTLKLVAEKLYNPKGDDTKLKKLIQGAKSELKFENKDPNTVSQALRQFVLYGENSDFLNRLTVKEVKELTSDQLLGEFKTVFDYEVDIHYSGVLPRKMVSEEIVNVFLRKKPGIKSESPTYFERKTYAEPVVFFINDKKAVQSQIHMLVEGEINSREERAMATAFNKYFSSDMSSIVFQEIREFRSLAYSAYAHFSNPFYTDKPGYLRGFLSTQADKTTEAIDAMQELYVNIPQLPERTDHVKMALIQELNSNRPTFRNISQSVEYWRKKGYNDDPSRFNLEVYENLHFEQIISVWEKNIAHKPLIFVVVGDEKRIDMEKLKQYGAFTELSKKDVFSK
jgi:zinc protease